ncbi:hypothetical protein SALBM135S_06335 [Streptomyces alboniger]
MTSSTRVRFSPREWKVTTPLVVPLAPSDVQVIRWSGTCSVVCAFQLRLDQKTLSFQSESVSFATVTFLTPLEKVENSWYWVHWS